MRGRISSAEIRVEWRRRVFYHNGKEDCAMTYPHVFSPITVGGIELKNRITMAPLYVGYASEDGSVSSLMLEHYRAMAHGGAAMIVVENTTH